METQEEDFFREEKKDIDPIDATPRHELSPLERQGEGAEILKDHLEKIEMAAKNLGDVIQGVCQKNPYTSAHISLEDGSSFDELTGVLKAEMLLVEKTFGREQGVALYRDHTTWDLKMIHEDLSRIGKSAQRLYELLHKASRNFALFNAENDEKKYSEANIAFGQDSLATAVATARALTEQTVRIDIDIVTDMQKMEKAQKN